MTPSAQLAGGGRVTRWTRETIIEKIAEWHERHGDAPCSADWNPSLARWRAQEWRIERYRDGAWPSTNAVKRAFDGSFDAAVRAAGLEPAKPGPRRAAHAARPAVAQRSEDPRVAELERRLAASERARRKAERRAERAEERAGDARRRARAAAERASRAKRARERVVETVETDIEQLLAEAEARVRAALDQAEAATRDAELFRREAAEARRANVAGNGNGHANGNGLSSRDLARLREGGPSGPSVLAGALRDLAGARATGDRLALARALGDVASAAIRWRDRL